MPHIHIIKDEDKNLKNKEAIKNMSHKDMIQSMLSILIDEYNCNHQMDLDSENQVQIYTRDKEQKFIEEFLKKGIVEKKSSLMYLCGHPGTGKTSTLHLVLHKFKT